MTKSTAHCAILCPGRLVRLGLRQCLEAAGFVVEADCGTPDAMLDVLEVAMPPDLIVLNLELDQRAADELADIGRLRAAAPEARLVVLTETITAPGLRLAMQAGIDGVLSTDLSGEVLKCALELVLLGQPVFPTQLLAAPEGEILLPTAPAGLPAWVSQDRRRPVAAAAPVRDGAIAWGSPSKAPALSERENQILEGLTHGCSNKMLARQFDVAEATIKVHIRAVLRKIRVINRTQAAIWAINNRPSAQPTHHS